MTRQKLAQWISGFGHPMLSFPVFIILMLFLNQPAQKAIWISALIILGVFIPMFLKIRRGTKSGRYTNFDISDRQQRKSFYPFIILLLSVVTAILYFTQQPEDIIRPILFALILILINYALNFYIKVSLHVSLTVFLGFLIFEINTALGIIFFLFGLAMAWSRLELKRHSFQEILLGILVGILMGSTYLFYQF